MTATIDSLCPRCGFIHPDRANALACDARHGRRWPNIHVRDPFVICALCGAGDALSVILDHMQYTESHRDVRTGILLRYVVDVDDISRYEAYRYA
jgi:hypothetical protein